MPGGAKTAARWPSFWVCRSRKRRPTIPACPRIHARLPLEVRQAMFVFVLQLAAEKNLLKGKTVAVDSTMLKIPTRR